MKRATLIILLAASLSCSDQNEDPGCTLDMDAFDFSFGIEYGDPDKYLIPGEQSDLSDVYFEEIKGEIDTPSLDVEGLLTICLWFNQNFTFENAGGNMIGKKIVDELYKDKIFYGCHSAALVISSVLREFGFPTVMIETASVSWAYDYIDGVADAFGGHVMTEVYVLDKWILLDNNGKYLDEYDCMNPYIASSNQINYDHKGLFCYAKGVDIWDYGVRSESDTHELMINFANDISCFEYLIQY